MSHKSVLPQKTQDDMRALMQVALGEEKADLAVVNARLVNVYTAEVQEPIGVAVKGPWIARVSADVGDTIGAETRVIDAAGRTLIPGLIDGHTHIAWIYSAAAFVPYAIASGVTTVVTETLEPYPVAGMAGVLDLLESLQDQPIRILATAPSMVSISTAARGISAAALASLLARQDILGLGESYWQAVLQEPDVYLPAYEQTLRSGKVLEGHSAGASEKKLSAYAAAGVSSCHEPINAEQVLTRLRLGMHVMVREGSIRRDLEEISKIRQLGLDLRRLDPRERRGLAGRPDAPALHGSRGSKGDRLRLFPGDGDPDGHPERGGAFPAGWFSGRRRAGPPGGCRHHPGCRDDRPRGRHRPWAGHL